MMKTNPMAEKIDSKQVPDKKISGVTHEYRSHIENERDGFMWINCPKIEMSHPLGTVYKYNGYGYVANGYYWYRFDLSLLNKFK